MKKVIIAIAAVVVVIAAALFFIRSNNTEDDIFSTDATEVASESFSNDGTDQTDDASTDSDSGKLEELSDGSEEIATSGDDSSKKTKDDDDEDTPANISNEVLDRTGKLNQAEVADDADDINQVLANYTSTMFNFSDTTEDYSDTLASYFGNSEYILAEQIDYARNVYEEFRAVNMKSEFEDFEAARTTVSDNGVCLEASVLGNIHASFENDVVPQGDYQVACSFVLLQEDGEWKLDIATIDNVYNADGFSTYQPDGYGDHVIAYQGTCVMTWNFTDIDNFLRQINPEPVDDSQFDEVYEAVRAEP